MRQKNIILLIKLILAFCSIVYELLLAQSLSAFLENTVLRYSITIGLYLFSMGFGALLAEGKTVKNPVLVLLKVEILLTLIGGFSVVILHSLNLVAPSRLAFSLSAHALIILVGVFTGFELPLLMEISNREKGPSENPILAVDYVGALLGSVFFAFIFYPRLGLVASAFFVASLNSLAGLCLFTQRGMVPPHKRKQYYAFLSAQAVLFVIIMFCLKSAAHINEFCINRYIGG
ncbi:MAG: hypothetical protein JW869_06970 [Candidatus Omnitrophica bacterium]|nr:hypothetical protein [Candidatus Omnitrophota bacterium]